MSNLHCSNKNCHLPNPQILKKLLQRFTHQELADIYGVNEKTIRRKLKPSNKEKQPRGVKKKIVGSALNLLLSFTAYRSKDNALTQQEMATRIHQEKGILVSQQTISRILIKKKQTHKKITPRYQEQDINKVKQFEENIRHLPLTQFSAIDECHFYLNESPRYGYAPIGQRVISPAPGSKGGSYSLIIWVKSKKEQGIVHWELTDKPVNTQVFHDFLDKVKVLSKEEDYLLMDNASIHRAPNKRKELGLPSIEEQLFFKNSQLLSLPSRSPQLNPVELIINVVRHNIEKSRSWTPKKLRDSISEEMERLNKEDLTKYFKKCLGDNLLNLINEADELIIIPLEDWKEIKRIVIEIDKLAEKDTHIYHECREVTNEFLEVMDEIEEKQEYRKVDI